jgi:glycosyltransferase involved in cell wall biosynthesis
VILVRRPYARATASGPEELTLTGRLVVVVLNFPAPEDRRVWALSCAAAAAGWKVTVVSPALRGHLPGRGRQDGIDLRWFRAFEAAGAVGTIAEAVTSTARATRAVLRERLGAGDVVHVCTPPDSLAPLLRLHARRGVGTLYDQHDVVPLLAAGKAGHRSILRLYEGMERATVRASSAVVTAGQVQADRLAELYGVRPTVVRTAAPLLLAPHVPPERATVLGYLGVLGEQDGVDRLVRAAALLRDRAQTELRVRIAGDGPEMPRLRQLVQDLCLEDVVELCGWLEEHQLEGFLEGVHGFVVPDPVTDFNHSCPMLKVSHALGAGLPVVMTPLRENLALTGGSGFVADGDAPQQLADAVERWLDAPAAARAAQGEALRQQWRRELDPARHMGRYVEALEEAVRSAKPARTRS